MRIEQPVEQQEDNACYKQPAEEPECSGHEFVVARHAGYDEQESCQCLPQSVGMGDAAGPVAELLVEDTEMEPEIVEQKEYDTPAQKGEIETLDAL